MSVSEDIRSTTPNINHNLCSNDSSSPLADNTSLDYDVDLDPASHLTFVRDVAPHQRSQYQHGDHYQINCHSHIRKKNHIIRIQGVKSDSDEKYMSVLPEIKVSLTCKSIHIELKLNTYLRPFFFLVSTTFVATGSIYACRCCCY